MLMHAVNTGDMDGVDIATAKLLVLTAKCRSVDLSEEEWRAFLDRVQRNSPTFQANYLLPGEVYAPIFPTIAANNYVLELPIEGDAEEDEVDV